MSRSPFPADRRPGPGDPETEGSSQVSLPRLIDEQDALRRLATLVAAGVDPREVFVAIQRETQLMVGASDVGLLRYEDDATVTALAPASWRGFASGRRFALDGDGVAARVQATRAPAIVHSYRDKPGPLAAEQRAAGQACGVGAPIVVEGRLWGVIIASFPEERHPMLEPARERLAQLSELLALAIANAETRSELRALAEEQALLRRVATLVAEGSSPAAIFAAVAGDLSDLLAADAILLLRFESELSTLVLASHPEGFSGTFAGAELSLDEVLVGQIVRDSGAPQMIDLVDLGERLLVRHLGLQTLAGAPIAVGGSVWGMAVAGWRAARADLPQNTLARLAEFCRLVAIAIANAESEEALHRLADEQAALRRVATLIAEGCEPEEIFEIVTRESAALLGADATALVRLDPSGDSVTILTGYGETLHDFPVGVSLPLPADRETLTGLVVKAGRAIRLDTQQTAPGPVRERLTATGICTVVEAPIYVDGRFWGTLGLAWHRHPPPAGVEHHAGLFTEVVGTAVSAAASRVAQRALAEQQAALRRVATVVAHGLAPTEVFREIAREARRLMSVAATMLVRYEPDGSSTVLAYDPERSSGMAIGETLALDGDSALARVYTTGAPARIESYGATSGHVADMQRMRGHDAAAAAPLTIEGRLWGALVASWAAEGSMPLGAESRLAQFTELIAAAIANSESRAELAASRARVVLAGDEARRRIQRDLHDGAQQRLVSLALQVREAQYAARELALADPGLEGLFDGIVRGVNDAARELQDIARGLHPAGLDHGGLELALRALVRRSAVPVRLGVLLPARLPAPLEVACYYVVSEALTNAVKHAEANEVVIEVSVESDALTVAVGDDGLGGADPARGTGLIGLRDRVEALGGELEISSPPGHGTTMTMRVAVSDVDRSLMGNPDRGA